MTCRTSCLQQNGLSLYKLTYIASFYLLLQQEQLQRRAQQCTYLVLGEYTCLLIEGIVQAINQSINESVDEHVKECLQVLQHASPSHLASLTAALDKLGSEYNYDVEYLNGFIRWQVGLHKYNIISPVCYHCQPCCY